MHRHLLLASAVLLGCVVAPRVMARDDDHHGADQAAFAGLWQAIDTFDGSTQFLSITCSQRHTCDVRLNDTAFTLSCQNQIGFAQGLGSIKRRVLTVELTLYCSNLDGTSYLAGMQVNQFVLDRGTDVSVRASTTCFAVVGL